MSLRERLARRIAAAGPITVAEYMHACLHDPQAGYYASRPRLGAAGDFITAPHVSQMFGELIGAWAAELWRQMGGPAQLRLVEAGPGDGALMADILRAARAAPDFLAALEIVLLETSAPLRARQAETLADHRPRWVERLAEIGEDAPAILIGNEFLDCAPIRQAVRRWGAWRERRVGVNAAGELGFTVGEPRSDIALSAPEGAVLETSPALAELGAEVGALVARVDGAALMLDYGRAHNDIGDTLQAVRRHQKEHPLARPGEADLTARVDFATFLKAAEGGGARAWPLLTQGELLTRLGLVQRADALAAANPAQSHKIARQRARLASDLGMGELFKAACVTAPGLTPPGFA